MNSAWWEILVTGSLLLEDSLEWRSQALGCTGIAMEKTEEEYLIRTYIPQNQTDWQQLSEFANSIKQDAKNLGLAEPTIQWRSIEEEDWASNWKQYWQPTEIGDRLIIYPAWIEPAKDSQRIILRLDPGSAFGTGTHPTTQLCLVALEQVRLASQGSEALGAIADIGCGSGILSIAALLLGASQIYATDIDPLAISATRHNLGINQLTESSIQIQQGSAEQLKLLIPEGVDGIVCNILAEVIIKLVPPITQLAKPGTWGIFSGILVEQAGIVTQALEAQGWKSETIHTQQSWCCLKTSLWLIDIFSDKFWHHFR